jgi:pre-mRNA-splicing helicase BRR2
VLSILGSKDDDKLVENQLVALFQYEHFDFVKVLLRNRKVIYYCSRLKQAQSDEEKREIEKEMEEDTGFKNLEFLI